MSKKGGLVNTFMASFNIITGQMIEMSPREKNPDDRYDKTYYDIYLKSRIERCDLRSLIQKEKYASIFTSSFSISSSNSLGETALVFPGWGMVATVCLRNNVIPRYSH